MTLPTQFCADIVAQGLKLGATDIAARLTSRKATKATAFDQHPQGTIISQANRLELDVYLGQRKAVLSTNDLSAENIAATLKQAIQLAKDANEDPYEGLAEPALYSPGAKAAFTNDPHPLTAAGLMTMARELEAAVRRVPGVSGVSEASASARYLSSTLVTSNGFASTLEKTMAGVGVDAAAEKDDLKTSFGDSRFALHAADLPDIHEFGQGIGKETAARLKQGTLKTSGVMPVVLHPDVASSLLLGNLASNLDALAMHEGKSWLTRDHLGQGIGHKNLTITDHWNLPQGMGSRLFDGDGIAGPEQLVWLEKGILQHFMVGLRGSRKSGLVANGRGSSTNLWLAAGNTSVTDLMADIQYGFYVTDTLGRGYNALTGDMSYSVGGYIIERGEITNTYVVAAGLAGRLQDLLRDATPANDLQMHRSVNAPTVRVEGLTVTRG